MTVDEESDREDCSANGGTGGLLTTHTPTAGHVQNRKVSTTKRGAYIMCLLGRTVSYHRDGYR
jgi:hypothetical protein